MPATVLIFTRYNRLHHTTHAAIKPTTARQHGAHPPQIDRLEPHQKRTRDKKCRTHMFDSSHPRNSEQHRHSVSKKREREVEGIVQKCQAPYCDRQVGGCNGTGELWFGAYLGMNIKVGFVCGTQILVDAHKKCTKNNYE